MPEGIRPQPMRADLRREPEPEPQPKRRFGLFGGRKDPAPEPRQEPSAQMQRPNAAPRATAQVMARGQDPQRNPAPQQNAEDLFPEHKKEDQFEIPAFLRRQQN
jgi:hypothetical protein